VKLKECVQWARRAAFGRGGTVIETEKDEWENGSTTFSFAFLKISFTNKAETNSILSVYS